MTAERSEVGRGTWLFFVALLAGYILVGSLPKSFVKSDVTLICFGDSITEGYNATPLSSGYCGLMSHDFRAILINYALSGSQAADGSIQQVYPNRLKWNHNPIFTIMFGVNDSYYYRADANKQVNYQNIMYGMATWLAIPQASKIFGQSSAVSKAGSWSNYDTLKTGLGIKSSTNGSTASFSITTTGGPIYIGYLISDGNGGVASVIVDGASAGTLYGYGQGGSLIATNLGATSGVGLLRYAVSAGAHSVVLTITSTTSATNVVTFLWAGTVPDPAGLRQLAAPLVAIGGVTKQYNDIVPVNSIYNELAQIVATQLAADGLNVVFAPVRSYVDPLVDMDASSPAHPNNQGHEHLRDAFESVMKPNHIQDSSMSQGR